jgi:hypothetical protein
MCLSGKCCAPHLAYEMDCGDVSFQPSGFLVDASRPVGDKLLDITDLERFLRENIKVQGKTGNLVGERAYCASHS